MKNVLVTGGLGFIGFNALKLWKKTRPDLNLFCLDCFTYAAQFKLEEKLKWCEDNVIEIERTSITNPFIESYCKRNSIDTIVNYAAETHVDNSIVDPNVFFQVNIIGTVNLLNIARKLKIHLHQVSTDEVYGPSTPEDNISVGSMLVPSSPYSSSKASADLIALSYFKTFGTKVTISRCTNNFGKYQHCEKLIGTVISAALNNQKIPVYGNGLQKRHWTFVDDHNKAVLDIIEKCKVGQIYNIGPSENNYVTNIDLIKFILKYLKKPDNLIEHVADRAAHDISYYLKPSSSFCYASTDWKTALPQVIDWYKDNIK